MAVITLLAVVTAMVMPQLRFNRERAVREEAQALADLLQIARSRAVVTGRAHRVRLDFAASNRSLEWRPPTEDAPPPTSTESADLRPPPSGVAADFEPVPDSSGRRA